MALRTLIDALRDRIVGTTTGLFAHAPYPLDNTLAYDGDRGLFGPDSATWPIVGDASAFIGGIRALVVQAVHPEVVAGVHEHSRYRDDPLGRLSRTSAYVTATAFGAMPEVEQAVSMVRRRHKPVAGTSHRGRAYSADDPEMAAWVHNVLTDSFLVAYQVFGPKRITTAEADRFVAEQAEVGRLLDASPLPKTAASACCLGRRSPRGGKVPRDDRRDGLPSQASPALQGANPLPADVRCRRRHDAGSASTYPRSPQVARCDPHRESDDRLPAVGAGLVSVVARRPVRALGPKFPKDSSASR